MSNATSSSSPGIVARALDALVSEIPTSTETPHAVPDDHARALAKMAAMKAAAISGTFTLPPGPFGLMTVLPDLLSVWRIQQQLVADIAATYGRPYALSRETMLICLFRHGGAGITQHLLSRGQNNDIVVNRIAHRALQQLLEKIAVRLGQRIAAKSVSRWLPIVGALGAGAYAYYDTTHVASNAIELFSKPLQLAAGDPAPDPEPSAAPATASSSTPRRNAKRARSQKKSPRASTTKRRPNRRES